jgi:NADH-quinone oxidoreductase subunit G
MITFSIDGREVQAPENLMLVDAAKWGDVEIPVFCYEPKLGNPVGACRMCLVEVEGIPKLQTGCSTPVKDGMVVHTQNSRVHEAQEAVVEFLLINHPLDCPVCDKGGECPLQDISFGWGGGRSRFIEPKRHFQKPLELSPLIAIDRERCILCYRCVRYSQEIAEDYQLVLQERGAQSYVATFDGHPYVAPFSGNIIELCPVGALTSRPYRFRARPWDIEGSGSVCTMCPGQCNVTFTVRDDRVLRVLQRDNHEVDDGWLCDRGRFAYQSIHVDERVTSPLVRSDDGELVPTSWDVALTAAADGLTAAKGRVAALAGSGATNEEGFLVQRIVRDALASHDLDSQRAPVSREALIALSDPGLQATVPDLEFAHAVLVLDTEPVDDMAILDLRIRKGVRRNHVKLAIASARPSALDPVAAASVRFVPGGGPAFAAELVAAATGQPSSDDARSIVAGLREAGDDVVILASERVGAALAALADALGLRDRAGAGLLIVPSSSNGRGLREVGFLPDAGPGLTPVAQSGRHAGQIAEAAVGGEVDALWLLNTDPLRDLPYRSRWAQALDRARTVIAHTTFLTEGILEHADVVFPAEAYAEKDGTLTHPDGRIQRVRPAIGHGGQGRYGWQVLADLGQRVGLEVPRVLTAGIALAQLAEAVPFYAGITQDEIGGRGIRWPERPAAGAFPTPPAAVTVGAAPQPRGADATDGGGLRLGTFRSIWASVEVEHSPALAFLRPRQKLEMSPVDADRLGLDQGTKVLVSNNGTQVQASVALRQAIPAGSVFLQDGLPEDSANVLTGSVVEVRRA